MIDRKKVARQTEEAAQRSGQFRYLKKNATTNLRIFEYKDGEGSMVFAQSMTEHRRQNQGGRGLGVCRQEVFGKPCAYCAANNLAAEQGQRPFISRTRYIVNAVDIDNEPGTVKLWVIPTSVFSDIADYACDDEWADILEPKKGFPFAVERSGQGLETSYTVKVRRKPYPVGKEIISQVVDPLGEIRDPGLAAQCAELNLSEDDLFNSDELEKFKNESSKSKKNTSSKTSKKSKKTTKATVTTFSIGQAVRYEDEDGICHVTEIDGDDLTIEDENKEEYTVAADQLTAVEDGEESESSDPEVGDRVTAEIEGSIYSGEITKWKGNTATVEFDDGDVLELDVDEITKETDGVPFDGKDAKDEDEAPKCFGDPNLYDEDDAECKKCSYYNECGGNAELNAAGVGDNRTPAHQSKDKKKSADDVISSIMGN